MNHKSDVIYAMVKDFKRRGVPIDGIGLQMHVPALDVDIPAIAVPISSGSPRSACRFTSRNSMSPYRRTPADRQMIKI